MYLVGGAHNMTIANWRVMFLICGGATLVIGVLFFFAMPIDTTVAWFLNDNERRIATERLALDRVTRDRLDFNSAQLVEALHEPLAWLYFLFAFCICLPSPILKVSKSSPLLTLSININANRNSFRLLSSTASDLPTFKPCSLVFPLEPFRSSRSGSQL